MPHSYLNGDSRPHSVLSRDEIRDRMRRIRSFADLRELWREDRAANGGRLTRPGAQAVALYRFGVWAEGHPNRFLRYPMRRLHELLYLVVRNLYGIELPTSARVGRRLRIAHQSGIVITPHAVIGNDCLIHQNVTIGSPRGGMGPDEMPRIGDRVEIGAGAVILGPVRIGHDSRIGPNTVVRADVPANSKVLPPEPEIRPRSSRPLEVRAHPPLP